MILVVLALENASTLYYTKAIFLFCIGDTLPVHTIMVTRQEWESQGGE